MPRPNRPRSVLAEVNLAQRVAHERAARRWSPEGLARRMADAGCPINVSAIYRIEQADPPRRITVDELVGFSRVFVVPAEELLLPIGLSLERVLVDRLVAWDIADNAALAAASQRDEAWESVRAYVGEHPEVTGRLESAIKSWASHYYENPEFAAARKLWALTGDRKWADVMKAEIDEIAGEADRG